MDLPPLSTPDPHTDKFQSSKVIPKRVEKVSNDDTEIITKVVSEKWKRVQYIRRVGKAWGQVGHVLGTALYINDENKWGKEMLHFDFEHDFHKNCKLYHLYSKIYI